MKDAQPENIRIRKINETKHTVDVGNIADLAYIEKRGSNWVLELSDKRQGDASTYIVTIYFNGVGNNNISLESEICAWLMNNGIAMQ